MADMWSRLTTLIFCGVLSSPCLAEIVTYYEYPFVDPLEATVLGTPDAYRAELPKQIPIEEREVLLFPGRAVPDVFWYTRALQYAVSAQPDAAPLVFIIPGTGANFNASKSLILQRALYAAGMHVVSLPSPIHPNFIVSASASRRPGLLAEDAVDLYRVMKLIRRQLDAELEILGHRLVGYSLGATNAAFVARLDDERGDFAFDKVLLINPPVDLERAARVLDDLFDEHIRSIADFNVLFNRLMAAFSELYRPSEEVLFSSDLLYEIYKRRPPTERTLEALIGAAFRLVSINLLFTSDAMARAGALVAPGRELTATTSLTPYFKAAIALDFEYYAREVLFPYVQQAAPAIGFEELAERNSLHVIGDYLRRTEKIGLMHNEDDIVLSEGDLDYLIEVFGDRAQIYPKGGHAGNMAFRDNVAYVVDFFAD